MERYFPVARSSFSRQVPTSIRLIKNPPPLNEDCSQKDDAEPRVIAPASHPSGVKEKHTFAKTFAKDASRADFNAVLLKTLGTKDNPITHSDIMERSDFVHSAATGHQRTEERVNRRLWHQHTEPKLRAQRAQSSGAAAPQQIFRNIRVYINGYLDGTTDIEIKRIVTEGGGTVVPTPSRSTHILTSTGLSGSKSQKFLTSKSQRRYIVKPEWILDSYARGKRRSESMYIVKLDRTSKYFG
ncbi:hypothetical protein CC1G_00422 [Coprinopsis cinerea okayama7|uniref:BRCT domain-containing protein n=1 Tax=Coprinopsis cinerea (strain Okayama-7 / 130 / ATCC MYA-4618 / FGSC 9003) TaxID=240176 RepID=A8NXW3_COPC7|nr:hypothetical protein CC1G_00422 [Coprinopsis cinerea okayama7\|eukprot:XP_001837286.2 hypothetical protein CC1G_00422 [Coprinopsis cinerea okayama7\